MPTNTQKINAEILKLSMDTIVELFELDATDIEGDIWYFHAGSGELSNSIIWKSDVYVPTPIKMDGFKYTGKAELPRPKLSIANLEGVISALCLEYDDLVGAKVVRHRLFARNLDGMPDADDQAHFEPDIFFIERKTAENKTLIEFELASSLDVDGVMLPRRQVTTNTCTAKYRSAECSFAGDHVVANSNDVALTGTTIGEWNENSVYNIGDVVWRFVKNRRFYYRSKVNGNTSVSSRPPQFSKWDADECSKRLAGCRLRFGTTAELPFNAFPGTRKAVGGS